MGNDKMGQRDGFSPMDVEKLNKMYECGISSNGGAVPIQPNPQVPAPIGPVGPPGNPGGNNLIGSFIGGLLTGLGLGEENTLTDSSSSSTSPTSSPTSTSTSS